MFSKNKSGRTESGITLIATNCELVGDVHFNDQLLVNGVVKGNIHARAGSKAVVTVSEKGLVEGEIQVPNVIINGKVCGDIRSDIHIELAAKAEVQGNIYYNFIEMVRGSRVDGNLVHLQDGKNEVKGPENGNRGIQQVKQEKPKTGPATVAAVPSKTA